MGGCRISVFSCSLHHYDIIAIWRRCVFAVAVEDPSVKIPLTYMEKVAFPSDVIP